MAEIGIDISQEFPKPMTDEVVKAADAVITMGCGDSCPIYPGKRYEDWEVTDPADLDLDGVRSVRDEIRGRVTELLDELLPNGQSASRLKTHGQLGPARAAGSPRASRRSPWSSRAAARSFPTRSTAGALGAVGVALVFGLIIMVMVYATGHLSGAHINPAVTVAFTLTRHFPARGAPPISPLNWLRRRTRGARASCHVERQAGRLGATIPTVDVGSAFVYEAILTAFLMFVIMAVATDTRAVGAAAAIAIGGTVGLDALFGGAITGASMNPARSFGPALASGEWTDFWIYLVAPVTGAALELSLIS